ncbi:MAG: RHS repeat-associated core domain-containing protein [Pseudomonadota bacterium]
MKKNTLLRASLVAIAWLGGIAHAGEQITYFHNDVLGSPVAATDQKGYVMWRATYEPYGERIQSTTDAISASNNTRWYGSHVQDDETGLLYMQARYEDPQLGRFLSIDPAAVAGDRPATFNRYSYGANNPYRYVDPDGRDFAEWWNGITHPFSTFMVPDTDSFRGGAWQIMGRPRDVDQTQQIFIDQTASYFETAWKAGARNADDYPKTLAVLVASEGAGELLGPLLGRVFGFASRTGAESSLQGFRLNQQLAAEQAAGARAPTTIRSWADHVFDQIAGRDGGIGVRQSALESAFANPNAIQYGPSKFGPTFRFVGDDATIAVNVDGRVTTGWANSSSGVAR